MSRLPSCSWSAVGRAEQKPTGRPEVSLWNASCGVAPCPMKIAVSPGQGPGGLGRAGAREVLSPHPFLRTPPILSSSPKPVKAPLADPKSCKSLVRRNLWTHASHDRGIPSNRRSGHVRKCAIGTSLLTTVLPFEWGFPSGQPVCLSLMTPIPAARLSAPRKSWTHRGSVVHTPPQVSAP
jgi:hypothetical protein